MKTTTVIVPQTKARIEAIAAAKSVGRLFHATGGSHLNYDDYFKSWLLLQLKETIKELDKYKEGVFNRTNVQCQKDTLLRTKGNYLIRETATSFNVAEINVLVRWKLNKVTPGNKQALINMYLELPNPPKNFPVVWWNRTRSTRFVQYRNWYIINCSCNFYQANGK